MRYLFFLIVLLFAQCVSAQEDSMNYLNLLKKPDWQPQITNEEHDRPTQIYNVPILNPTIYYHEIPLKPLKLDVSDVERYKHFAQLSLGNLQSAQLYAGVGLYHKKDQQVYALLHAYRAKGKLLDQQNTDVQCKVFFDLQKNERSVQNEFGVDARYFRYYGYDHNRYTYADDMIQSSLFEVQNTFKFSSLAKGAFQFENPNYIKARYTALQNRGNELGLQARYHYFIAHKSVLLQQSYVALDAQLNNYNASQNNFGSAALGLRAYTEINRNKTNYQIAIQPSVFQGRGKILFDVKVERRPLNKLFYGFKIGHYAELNTLSVLKNSALFLDYLSQIKTTSKYASAIFARGQLNKELSFETEIGVQQQQNLPIFYQSADSAAFRPALQVAYLPEALSVFSRWAIGYMPNSSFKLSASLQTLHFLKLQAINGGIGQAQLNRAYSYWPVRYELASTYQINKKWLAQTSWIGFNSASKYEEGNKTMSGGLDVNVGLQYSVAARWHLLLQANNLLNQAIEYLPGYRQYGTNVQLGVRCLF